MEGMNSIGSRNLDTISRIEIWKAFKLFFLVEIGFKVLLAGLTC